MLNKKNSINQKTVSIFLYAVSMGLVVLLFILSLNESIWKDEVFDLLMIRHPYSYFMFSSRDAAPPVHFVILKFCVELMKKVVPMLSEIIVSKWVSIIPYVIIQVVSLTYVRKKYGRLASAIFSFCVLTMPHLFTLGIEIRQYSWSVLFMLLFYVSYIEYMENGRRKHIVLLAIFGALAACTHYYACFGIVFAIVPVFVAAILKKNKENIRKTILSGVGVGVLFLPWFFILLKSFSDNVQSLHITINKDNILDVLFYIIMPESNKFNIGYLLAIVLLGYCICLFIMEQKSEDKEKLYHLLGLLMPFFILFVGLLITVFLWPVFQPRYIMPCMAIFWLNVAIITSKNKNTVIYAGMCLLLLIGGLNVAKNTKDELIYDKNIKQLKIFFEDLSDQDIIVTNNKRIPYCFGYYIDNEILHWNTVEEQDYDQVTEWLKEGKKVYFFNLDEPKECDDLDVEQNAEKHNLLVNDLGKYGLEYVFSQVYEVEYSE